MPIVCDTEAAGLGVRGIVIVWATAVKQNSIIDSNCVVVLKYNFLIFFRFGNKNRLQIKCTTISKSSIIILFKRLQQMAEGLLAF
jgi:hypothetical protein